MIYPFVGKRPGLNKTFGRVTIKTGEGGN